VNALHRVHRASELRKDTVTRRVRYAASVFLYGPVEDCAPFGPALERADLIDTHEAAVAFDIRLANFSIQRDRGPPFSPVATCTPSATPSCKSDSEETEARTHARSVHCKRRGAQGRRRCNVGSRTCPLNLQRKFSLPEALRAYPSIRRGEGYLEHRDLIRHILAGWRSRHKERRRLEIRRRPRRCPRRRNCGER
jgi:hypothetical protein